VRAISDFKERHADWLRKTPPDQPVYRLPDSVIQVLGRPGYRRVPILGTTDVAVEEKFNVLCSEMRAIGIWADRPVTFVCLGAPLGLPPLTKARIKSLGWSAAQALQAQEAVRKANDASLRLKGYIGWLVSDRQFLAERDSLAERWRNFTREQRPSFPLRRLVALPELPRDAVPAAKEIIDFQSMLDAFLDRWSLVQLVTWDLPEPQGPLMPALFAANAPAMPKHGIHIVLPVHYPLTAGDGLLHDIQRQQAQLALDNDLDTSIAGLPHFEILAQMFDVSHIEKTARSRYRSKRGDGFVAALEAAIGAELDVDPDHVTRLRKGISKCLRGRRSSIRWLRAPTDNSGS
jgi:hypothetical protein